MQDLIAFGYHDRESPRHRTVCAELTKDGGQVIECHTDRKGLFGKYADLRRKFRALSSDGDVLVPFPGHFLMPLAWWLTRRPRRRLIFDAFISLYDTDVSDRQRFSAWNPRAWMLWIIDWVGMHLADEVLIDTEAHKKFLVETFGLKPERVRVIYLQARTDLFSPSDNQVPTTNKHFEVFFYGTVIPLQGIDYILEAAKILEEKHAPVHFTMVGSSKLIAMIERMGLRNVTARGFVPLQELPAMIRSADLCLGIFGTSGKAQRVIPHKVVDSVACGKLTLTADTPAIRERYADDPLVRRIPAGSSAAIVRAISTLIQEKRGA